jgi:hypothetical protein
MNLNNAKDHWGHAGHGLLQGLYCLRRKPERQIILLGSDLEEQYN